MTTYHFTHNGETRELNPCEIKRWTGIPMAREALQTNLEWLAENIGNPKYKLLAFTFQPTHWMPLPEHPDGKA